MGYKAITTIVECTGTTTMVRKFEPCQVIQYDRLAKGVYGTALSQYKLGDGELINLALIVSKLNFDAKVNIQNHMVVTVGRSVFASEPVMLTPGHAPHGRRAGKR
jgi:hypothetical protein